MSKFKIGSLVKLNKSVVTASNETARIKLFLEEIVGGVMLDSPIAEFRYWNINDLELVEE